MSATMESIAQLAQHATLDARLTARHIPRSVAMSIQQPYHLPVARWSKCLALACCIALQSQAMPAAELGQGESYTFQGDLRKAKDISGIALHKDLLIVCTDEKCSFNGLEKTGDASYKALPPIQLDDDEDTELDLEGVASDGDYLYLVGSHSLVRKGSDAEKSYDENRGRLTEVEPQPSRNQLFRLKVDEHGELKSKERVSLDNALRNDSILKPFVNIPSKENGIDLEGIAVSHGKLLIGFRGPVLRDNYAPVMVFDYAAPNNYELRFVDLAGRGIRDITAIDDGFLIVAGPVGDGDASYQLYYWNGKDGIIGTSGPGVQTKLLGEIPTDGEAKAEGITVVLNSENDCTIVVVFDGVKNGAPKKFVVNKSWK